MPHIERCVEHPVRYLFSRSGFSKRLREHAATDERLKLVTPAEIYERS